MCSCFQCFLLLDFDQSDWSQTLKTQFDLRTAIDQFAVFCCRSLEFDALTCLLIRSSCLCCIQFWLVNHHRLGPIPLLRVLDFGIMSFLICIYWNFIVQSSRSWLAIYVMCWALTPDAKTILNNDRVISRRFFCRNAWPQKDLMFWPFNTLFVLTPKFNTSHLWIFLLLRKALESK